MDLHPEMVDATMELRTVHALYQQGDFAKAAALCDQILDTYARHGLTVGAMPARVLQSRGAAQIGQGKPNEAMKALGRGISVLGPPGGEYDDPAGRGRLLATTAHALRMLGRYGPAREAYEMAIPLLREDPNESLIAAINSLGALISHLGDVGRAKALYEEAWNETQEIEVDEDQRAWILLNLGGACGDLGELQVAVGHLEAAVATQGRPM